MNTSSTINLTTKYGVLLAKYVEFNGKMGVVVKATRLNTKLIPVRVQSSCLFSESLGAIDCDCAAQLDTALQIISKEGGVLLYIYEEGRGAGLQNKIEAIALQCREKIDTASAFAKLGLPRDLRNYEFAAQVLAQELKNREISLLTNNPNKVDMLERNGLKIQMRRSLICADSSLVRTYLFEKANVLGHDLSGGE